MSWEDDIEAQLMLGGGFPERHEIGDSVSGMQYHDMVGAAKLAALKGRLARLNPAVAARYGRHQPAIKPVPSQYRDSGQISISASITIPVTAGTFTAAWTPPTVSGASTVYTSFKPNRVVLTEQVIATFNTSALGTSIVAADSVTASDLLLISAFSGALNNFPNAPIAATGIHGPAIAANAFGVGISWPTVNAAIPVTATFGVLQTILFRAAAPTNYVQTNLTSLTVNIYLAMFGPQLR